jgi:RecA/RadA recombinase
MSSITDKLIAKFNDGDVVKFSDKDIFKDMKTWIHSGSPELEANISILGFPVGITEIAGKSRSGKTTLALMGMKNFQKEHPDGVCIILSSENRDNKEYAQQIGIDTKKVIIVKSKFVEDLFLKLQIQLNMISKLWDEDEELEGKPKVFIFWDSLGATLSRSEQEVFQENVKKLQKSIEKGTKMEMDHSQPGAFAKQGKASMKNILSQIYEMDIVFIILNHTMAKIGGRGGRTSGGGEWIEYLPTLRLETILIENEKIDDVEVAQYTKIKIIKNDFGPRKETIVEILLGYGLVLSENDIKYALDKGILNLKGKTGISFLGDKLVWNSKRTFYQNYKDKNKFLPILHKRITNARHKDILIEKGIAE